MYLCLYMYIRSHVPCWLKSATLWSLLLSVGESGARALRCSQWACELDLLCIIVFAFALRVRPP